MKNFLRLIVVIIALSFAISANASSLECRNLFVSNTDAIKESDIETRVEALALSYLRLDETKPELRPQITTQINKELSSLIQLSNKNLILFKEKVSELRDRVASSRQRKEKEDETKRKEREKIIDKDSPINLARKAIFHDIEPGTFMMGDEYKRIETTITTRFAMMDTPLTQMMWARLQIAMGEKNLEKINPSKFVTGADSVTVNIDGIRVEMQPNHPVEYVSYNDIVDFINGLNLLSKSKDIKVQTLLQNIIPGHKKYDFYDLPTEAQHEFVMRNRGNANEDFFDRDDFTEVGHYAWFRENSDGQTQQVARKHPRLIDGKAFYDLEGNVSEWNKDWKAKELSGGINPQGPKTGQYRVFRSGGFGGDPMGLIAGWRGGQLPDNKYNSIGFRLIKRSPNL